MRPRNKPLALGGLLLTLALGLTGCPGGGDAPGGSSAPPQPGQGAKAASPAKAAAPAPPPATPYVYETRGRRDPFKPLIAPKVETPKTAKPKTGLAALGVSELKLAGIVWGRRGYHALVEAPNGVGYVLRINDSIGEDAKVTKITPEGVTFEVRMETPLPQARTRLVELRLGKEE